MLKLKKTYLKQNNEAKKESDGYRSVNNLHVLLEEKELMIYDSFFLKLIRLFNRTS